MFTQLELTNNVTVMSLQDYLLTHFSTHSELLCLHESLAETVKASKGDETIKALGYTTYLPDTVISERLKNVSTLEGYFIPVINHCNT